ncbi:MAG: DUF3592 domain-containing protein [Planctomycetota bacterium]|nr:MAG: DUF3592 domain-containing protein [Planctomycetota bacterium]
MRRILLPLLLFLAGLFAVVAGVKERALEAALDDHGKTVTATIESAQWKRRKLSRNYSLTVSYPVESARPMVGKVHVSDATFQRHVDADTESITDDKIEVRYLPEDPKSVREVGYAGNAVLMMSIGGVGAVLGLCLTMVALTRKRA